jgi:hypothetical protein
MKIVFVATLISILISATLAAPTQTMGNSDLKHQLLKSIINQARIQQHSPSSKDKEFVATFCKLASQVLKLFGDESLNLRLGDVPEDDYCQDIEFPSVPGPDISLADVYQKLFNILKNSGLDNALDEYYNFMLNRIG